MVKVQDTCNESRKLPRQRHSLEDRVSGRVSVLIWLTRLDVNGVGTGEWGPLTA